MNEPLLVEIIAYDAKGKISTEKSGAAPGVVLPEGCGCAICAANPASRWREQICKTSERRQFRSASNP